MHSVIFVARVVRERSDWTEFLAEVAKKTEKNSHVLRLAENVWLVSFHQSPAGLAWLTTLCEQRGIAYGILPLADEPQWLPAGLDPKTTLARSE